MANKFFLQTSYLDVYSNASNGLGYVLWKGWASEDAYIKAMDAQLKMVLDSKLEGLLCDIREFKGTTTSAQKYTTDEIIPKINNAQKLSKIAYVVGESVFANFTLTVIRKDIAKKNATLTTNAFKSIAEAEAWLLSKN